MQVKRLYSTELAALLGNQTKLVALPEKRPRMMIIKKKNMNK